MNIYNNFRLNNSFLIKRLNYHQSSKDNLARDVVILKSKNRNLFFNGFAQKKYNIDVTDLPIDTQIVNKALKDERPDVKSKCIVEDNQEFGTISGIQYIIRGEIKADNALADEDLTIWDKCQIGKAEAPIVDVNGQAIVNEIVAANLVCVYGNSKVGNITLTGNESPELEIADSPTITGKIIFANGNGKVILIEGPNGVPLIDKSQIIGGEIKIVSLDEQTYWILSAE